MKPNDAVPPDMVKAVDKLKKIIGGREMEVRSIPPINISMFDVIAVTGMFEIGSVAGNFNESTPKPIHRLSIGGGHESD